MLQDDFLKKAPAQHLRFGMQSWFRSLGGWLLLALPHWRIPLRIHLREVLCQLQRRSSLRSMGSQFLAAKGWMYCHLLQIISGVLAQQTTLKWDELFEGAGGSLEVGFASLPRSEDVEKGSEQYIIVYHTPIVLIRMIRYNKDINKLDLFIHM